jgi:hypothetical protein
LYQVYQKLHFKWSFNTTNIKTNLRIRYWEIEPTAPNGDSVSLVTGDRVNLFPRDMVENASERNEANPNKDDQSRTIFHYTRILEIQLPWERLYKQK